ncbi:MAG: M23 family metallopeptidase, partial [Bacteroidota bacterium]
VAFPGMVRVASYQGGYGRLVIVRHHNGLETSYAHLHRLRVKPGQMVKAGDLIGLGGSSGNSTGSHLHFECRFKGIPINPLNFISIKEKALIGDTLVLRKTKYGYAAYPSGVIVHTVTPGDNLYDIAKKYGTTTYRLCELNGIRRNAMLIVGQRIRVI